MKESNLNSRCLLDNWSLECAATLIEDGIDKIYLNIGEDYPRALTRGMPTGSPVYADTCRTYINDVSIYFGALSNVLNAIVLFDDVVFVRNGFEVTWQRYATFFSNTKEVLRGVDYPAGLDRSALRTDYGSANYGAPYYCYLSKVLDCDLLVNPLRSEHLIKDALSQKKSYSDLAFDLLESFDKSLIKQAEALNSRILNQNLVENLMLPSLTNLVLSESANSSEILTVAKQLKESPSVVDFRNTLKECLHNLKASTNYSTILSNISRTIENSISKIRSKEDDIGSIGINILFVSLSYNVKKLFHRETYTLFLRKLANCRLELDGIKTHLRRLFRYTP